MNSDRAAFEAALEAARCDLVTRSVYADWLEQEGFDDEALEQRRMATPEWVEAARWLEDFAARCGETCTNFDEVGLSRGRVQPVWRDLTFDDMVRAGAGWLEDFDPFYQEGSAQARNLIADGAIRELYWRYWSVVTGRAGPTGESNHQHQPFACSC